MLQPAHTFISSPPQDPSVSPTPGPAAKPAEESSPPRPATAPSSDDAALTLSFLYGWVECHDPEHRTALSHKLDLLNEYFGATEASMDPKRLWSADYGLADKLGNELEALNADLAQLRTVITDLQDRRQALENLDAIKAKLEAAIKTCNELGLPF